MSTYVFFHGLFVFVDRPKVIEVIVPDLGHLHSYRIGPYLREENFQSGIYRLRNVEPGQESFASSGVDGVRIPDLLADDAPAPYATIKVPLPSRIICGARFGVSGAHFTPQLEECAFGSSCYVFVYDHERETPELAGRKAEHWGGASGDYHSLHVIAEGPEDDTNHANTGVNTALKYFGVKRSYRGPGNEGVFQCPANPGLALSEEYEPLFVRSARMKSIVSAIHRDPGAKQVPWGSETSSTMAEPMFTKVSGCFSLIAEPQEL